MQGGTDVPLRIESVERTLAVGFDGYAIGGLSVGESRTAMLDTLAAVLPLLPPDQPRYLMGLGDPIGIVESVALGIDLFDCVLPTRFARHGTILSSQGRYNLKRAENSAAEAPPGRRLRLPGLRPVVAGVPASPADRGRAHRAPAPHPAQRLVDPRPGGRGAGRGRGGLPGGGAFANRGGLWLTSSGAPATLDGSSRPHPMRRKKLAPLIFIVLVAAVSLGAVLITDTSPHLGLDLQGGASVVLQPTEEASDEALSQTIEIIRSRVDAKGVAEPEITRQGNAVVVQLPGVDNQQELLDLVATTAELRFRPVLQDLGDYDALVAADSSTTTTAADGSTTTTAADGSTTTTAPETTTPRR